MIVNQQDIKEANLTEMVFEHRNKKYGAYHLRRVYSRHVLLGLAFSISLLVFGLLAPYVADLLMYNSWDYDDTQIVEINKMPEPPGSMEFEYFAPIKVEPENVPPVVVKDSVPEVKRKIIVEPKPDENTTTNNNNNSTGTGNAEGNGSGTGDDIYITVDEKPVPPGGKISDYIARNLRYPEKEKTMNIQGKVLIGCIINKDGTVSNVMVKKGVSTGLDSEALRVVSTMPAWKPAIRQGQPVKVYVQFYINFTMSN